MSHEFEESLLALARDLDAASRRSLLDFAEFLAARCAVAAQSSKPLTTEPALEAPPPGETVVAALQRLRRSYPMLDQRRLLGAAAELTTAHWVQGRDTSSVIGQLEALFAQHYQALNGERGVTATSVDASNA